MNVILWLLFSLGFGEVSVAHPAPSCRGTVLEIDGEDVCVERSMALANRHSCAIRDGGRLYCWGDLAQVGGGVEAGDGEFRPQEVPGLEGVVEVVGSPQPSENAYPSPSLPGSTCARLSSGEVWCWRRRSSDRPEEPAATEAVGVAMSLHEVCVATAEGRVLCHQHARRSGQPVAGELRGPEEVDGISEVVDVVGGWAHFRALHEDQRVSCWGDNRPAPSVASGVGMWSLGWWRASRRWFRSPPGMSIAARCAETERCGAGVEINSVRPAPIGP